MYGQKQDLFENPLLNQGQDRELGRQQDLQEFLYLWRGKQSHTAYLGFCSVYSVLRYVVLVLS